MEVARDDGPWQLYAKLSTPTVVVAEDGWRVVFLNAAAQRALTGSIADAVGRVAWAALDLEPAGGGDPRAWAADMLVPSLDTAFSVPCRQAGRPVQIGGLWINHEGRRYAALTITDDPTAATAVAEAAPDWVVRDAQTGLYNRSRWDREFPERNARGGTVIFFEVDGWKAIADLSGRPAADAAVGAAAAAMTAEAPERALLVRYSGDEFVLATDESLTVPTAQELAQRVRQRAARTAAMAGLSLPLHLRYGIADFAPGDLAAAVRRAAAATYESDGILLRGSQGGRIILTHDGRARLQQPGIEPEPRSPAPFAANFGPEFADHFRKIYARTREQAREFVDFVAPEAGWTVVEVAAGPGRITYDGGLAARIGPDGQLLVTDASAAQIQVARRRAHELGLNWLRFLQAPVEDLPLASGTVDLILGSTFLHYTDPPVALSSMARVVRPGGQVAVNATVDASYGSAWEAILEPVRRERALYGLKERSIFLPQSDLEAAFARAGLQIIAVRRSGREHADFSNGEVAVGMVRQLGLVGLMLLGVPAERHGPVQAEVEERVRAATARQRSPEETAWSFDTVSILARK